MRKLDRPKVGRVMIWAVMMLSLTISETFAASTRWEIVPKSDSRVPAGKVAVIGGLTGPEGVRLVLNNIALTTPVQVTLVSENQRNALQMLVFKESPEKPLLQGSTGADGSLTFRFRTEESAQFLVRGSQETRYQMMVWVGPHIQLEPVSAFVPMDQYLSKTAAEAPRTDAPATPNPTSYMGSWIPILLALILVALVVIIVLLFRRQKKGAVGMLLLLALGGHSVLAQENRPMSLDEMMKPSTVSPAETKQQISETLNKIREGLERLEKAGIKVEPSEIKLPKTLLEAPGTAVTSLKLLLGIMEQFGLIDPREAAVQPNYNPPGQPPLPSRCYNDPGCARCFKDASPKLEKAGTLLENLYVIYKQAELQAGRIIELADAATGLSPYGKLLWTVTKTKPDPAQEKFYATYDENLQQLLNMMNDGLIAIGDCERKNYGDQDWYSRYGMPYYTFTRERYTRK